MFFLLEKQVSRGRGNFILTKMKLSVTTKTKWAGGEMVYTLALGASAARHGSSSLPLPTSVDFFISIYYYSFPENGVIFCSLQIKRGKNANH